MHRQNWNGELRRWVKEMLVVGRSNFRTLGGRVSVDVIESRKDVFNPESKVNVVWWVVMEIIRRKNCFMLV